MAQDLVTFRKCCEAVGTFEKVVTPSFGPCGSNVLISTNTGQCLVSKDGQTIMDTCVASEPVERWIKKRIKSYYKSSGDGSKSYVLLMSSLLQRIQAYHSHCGNFDGSQVSSDSLKQFCLELSEHFTILARQTIPATVAEKVISSPLCVNTSFYDCDEFWEFLSQLTFSVLQSNLTGDTARLLSTLVVNFVKLPKPEILLEEHISLIVNSFGDFCQEVSGYPVADSYVTDGVLIQRDFAYLDPSLSKFDSDINVVVFACDFIIEERAVTPCISLSSTEGVSRVAVWNEANWRKLVSNLNTVNVRAVISVNTIPGPLLASLRLAGISVVHSVYAEDLEQISVRTGIPLNYDIAENMTWTLHKVSFLKRTVLGKKAFCHAGFRGETGQILKHLVLCGPTSAICRSYSVAIQKSLKSVLTMMSDPRFRCAGLNRNCDQMSAAVCDGRVDGNQKELYMVFGGGAIEVLAGSILREISEKCENKVTRVAFRCFAEALDVIPRTLHNNSYQVNHKRYLEGKVGDGFNGFTQAIHPAKGHWLPARDVSIVEALMHKLVLWQQVLETLCDLFRIESVISVGKIPSCTTDG